MSRDILSEFCWISPKRVRDDVILRWPALLRNWCASHMPKTTKRRNVWEHFTPCLHCRPAEPGATGKKQTYSSGTGHQPLAPATRGCARTAPWEISATAGQPHTACYRQSTASSCVFGGGEGGGGQAKWCFPLSSPSWQSLSLLYPTAYLREGGVNRAPAAAPREPVPQGCCHPCWCCFNSGCLHCADSPGREDFPSPHNSDFWYMCTHKTKLPVSA